MSANLSSLMQEFLLEAHENTALLMEALPKLEKAPSDKELLNSVFRAVHTIKGGARFVKLPVLENFAHILENLLDKLREDQLKLDAKVIDLLLACTDHFNVILKKVQETAGDDGMMNELLFQRVSATIEGRAEPVVSIPEVQESSEAKSAPKNDDKNNADSVVRVNVNLLDKIMNVVGELVLTRNQIMQFANNLDSPDLHKLCSQLNNITGEIQSDIMQTRMQPIGSVLGRFERIVRDLARDLGKKVVMKIEGKDTELDKTLLEAIKDPLTHMVRNAVDHALETVSERKAAGKPEEGTILIKSYHEGGQVTIEIKDDGKGINRARILQKAIEKEIVTPEKAAKLSDKEALGLIFLPGFSTASKVTNISGRGVGMDVVRTNIERIGGQIDLSSEEGVGTTFKLRIPLTLAIIPALIVSDSKQSFALPQINLVELVRLEGEKLKQIEQIHGAEFFRLRGELIPLLRLKKILKLKNPASASAEEIESENIVVLNADGRFYGLIVDQILDTQEIVVKPLSKNLKSLSSYAGATIMGDGHVALILDVLGIAAKNSLLVDAKPEKTREDVSAAFVDRHEILLFKLSGPGLFAVPLIVVNRLEEFRSEQIEFVGENRVIRYRNEIMHLIRLEGALGLPQKESSKEVISVFVAPFGGKYYGFEVEEILDIGLTDFEVKTSSLDQEGFLGSLFVNEKTVSLIDIHWVAEILKLQRKSSTGALEQGAGLGQKRPKILVADDMALFRKIASLALDEMSYETIIVTDGLQALNVLKESGSEISMIISDIEMPHMGGLELARQVRLMPEFKNIPMIAVSSLYDERDIEAGYKAGFDMYLEKFKKQEVAAAVKQLLAQKVAA